MIYRHLAKSLQPNDLNANSLNNKKTPERHHLSAHTIIVSRSVPPPRSPHRSSSPPPLAAPPPQHSYPLPSRTVPVRPASLPCCTPADCVSRPRRRASAGHGTPRTHPAAWIPSTNGETQGPRSAKLLMRLSVSVWVVRQRARCRVPRV